MVRSIHSKNIAGNPEPHHFWTIWSEYQSRLLHCCLHWLNGNYTHAEDALSQALEKSYHCFQHAKEHIRNPFSWLYRLTYTICIDMLREQKKQQHLVEIVSASPEQFYFSAATTECLEELIQRDDTLDNLEQAFENLNIDLKKIIQHRFIEERDYPEIAEIMQITPENARKRVQLARKQLRFISI